jgi:Fe2+ transport system protein B
MSSEKRKRKRVQQGQDKRRLNPSLKKPMQNSFTPPIIISFSLPIVLFPSLPCIISWNYICNITKLEWDVLFTFYSFSLASQIKNYINKMR